MQKATWLFSTWHTRSKPTSTPAPSKSLLRKNILKIWYLNHKSFIESMEIGTSSLKFRKHFRVRSVCAFSTCLGTLQTDLALELQLWCLSSLAVEWEQVIKRRYPALKFSDRLGFLSREGDWKWPFLLQYRRLERVLQGMARGVKTHQWWVTKVKQFMQRCFFHPNGRGCRVSWYRPHYYHPAPKINAAECWCLPPKYTRLVVKIQF